jgi:adenylate cyclase
MDTKPDRKPGSRGPLSPLVLAIIAGLLLLLAETPAQLLLRNYQFDQFQRWHPRSDADQAVRIVDVDEASLRRLGQWPWSRTQLAGLLDALRAAGARAVVFDLVFSEPDRTAPRLLAGQWQLAGDAQAQVLALPDPDTVFANSLRQAPTVLGYALLNAGQPAGHALLATREPFRLVELGPSQRDWLPRAPGALPALPLLQAAAAAQGALGFVPDGDGVVRCVPLLLQVGDSVAPSLVTETLRLDQGVHNLVLNSAGHDNGLASLRIGELTLPTTAQGQMCLHYRQPDPARTVPAWQVLQGHLPLASLAGAMVLVGSSAQGLMDLRFGPLGQLPGVEVHAQALEQALSGHMLQRPAWARGLEAVVLLLGSGLLGFLALRRQALAAALGGLTLLALLLAAAWWAFVAQGLLLDAATPACAWLLCYLLCSLWQHRWRERQQRWLRQAFARYVSPNRVAWLLAHPQTMALGGRRQQCSFVFTDLTGFTALMENLDPAQAVNLLNGYLDAMVAIAFRFEGTLDRIVGDAVAIMFSAPVEQADHRARALACALAMDAFAVGYAQQMLEQGMALGQTRIGVHSGEVIVGNFGGRTVFDYRALGDPVNTAARLESANKQLGTRVCVSGELVAGQGDAALRPVGRLLLPGKSQALAVFEPCQEGTVQAPLPDYLAAFEAMQKQQPQALQQFAQLAQAWPEDPLVRLHHGRLLAGESGEQVVIRVK